LISPSPLGLPPMSAAYSFSKWALFFFPFTFCVSMSFQRQLTRMIPLFFRFPGYRARFGIFSFPVIIVTLVRLRKIGSAIWLNAPFLGFSFLLLPVLNASPTRRPRLLPSILFVFPTIGFLPSSRDHESISFEIDIFFPFFFSALFSF